MANAPVCAENEDGLHFSTTSMASLFFVTITRRYLCHFVWLVSSSTIHCNCLRKSYHLSSWACMGVERRMWSELCLIVDFSCLQFIKEAENTLCNCRRRIREKERGDVSWGRQSEGQGCFIGCFSVISTSLKKFHTSWLAKHCFPLLFRRPTSSYRRTIYVHSKMHAVSVCFRR